MAEAEAEIAREQAFALNSNLPIDGLEPPAPLRPRHSAPPPATGRGDGSSRPRSPPSLSSVLSRQRARSPPGDRPASPPSAARATPPAPSTSARGGGGGGGGGGGLVVATSQPATVAAAVPVPLSMSAMRPWSAQPAAQGGGARGLARPASASRLRPTSAGRLRPSSSSGALRHGAAAAAVSPGVV